MQTQVLPYLRQIVSNNLKVSIVTFEPDFKQKWSAAQIKNEQENLAAQNISWYCLPYHKSPSVPATFYDVLNGIRFCTKLAKKEKIDVFHCRSHVAAMIGSAAKKMCGGKLLFDIRGFFPEEYTDAGRWKENGKLFKAVKGIEKKLLAAADGFVVLTEKAQEILFPESEANGFDKLGRPVEVIPCCVNLNRFPTAGEALGQRASMRKEYNLENRRVIVYVGSLGTWYMADEMTDFMASARKCDSSVFALVLTQSPPEEIIKMLEDKGFAESDFLVRKVSPSELGHFLSGADIALSFIKPCFSKLSSSPTKIAEYLACGLPIVSNSGVGDLDEVIAGNDVGVIVKNFTEKDYIAAFEAVKKLSEDTGLKSHCRTVASQEFDLERVGGKRYRRLYERMLSEN